MNLLRWNPFGEFSRLRDDVRNMFPDSPLIPFGGLPFNRMHGPSVDVRETENEVIVSAEIPGANPDEFNVTVNENQLVLRGEVKRGAEHDREGYRMMERRYGSFYRTIHLPVEVKPDEAWADYKNGVLEIRMNKSEKARQRSHRIKVTGGQN